MSSSPPSSQSEQSSGVLTQNKRDSVFGDIKQEFESFKKQVKDMPLEEKAAEVISDKQIRSAINLEWELKAPCNSFREKQLFPYDESVERCSKINPNNRHPYSYETFDLIIRCIEGESFGNDEIVYNDMVNNEWLNQAFMRESEKRLIVYYNPNLVWDGKKYVPDGKLQYSKSEKFYISKIPSLVPISLERYGPEFVKAFCGRELSKLPQVMREGRDRIRIALPPVGMIWPLCRGGYRSGNVILGCGDSFRVSRWVREKN